MKRTHWGLAAVMAAILGSNSITTWGQDADPGLLFKRLDKNGDGQVATDEVPEEQQGLFQRLLRRGDKNGDGKLTAEEFEKANKPDERPDVNLTPDANGGGDARERFQMLDRNKDGKVTLDEVPEPLRERLKPIFDRSGKKELTIEELGRLGGGGRPDPAEFFKRFDANSDGKISKDELPAEARQRFAPLFERLGKDEMTLEQFQQAGDRLRESMGRPGMGSPDEAFGRLDTNGDGKLTIEEVPERARPMVEATFRRAGKEATGSLSKEEFVKNMPERRDGERPPASGRRPEGDNPRGAGDDRPGSTPRPGGGDRAVGRGPAFLRVLDTNRDGRLSKDELSKAAAKFDELDQNHDGQLDPTELNGGSEDAPERRPEPRSGDAPARDGERRPATSGEERPRDGNREDGRRRPEEGDAPSRERPAPLFQRFDRDADGRISKDEAPEPLKERFGMLDANGDGFISLDEFRAGAASLGERIRDRSPARPKPETPADEPRRDKQN
jgi:Ca2+-binding EF-hand superfamily protein